MRQRKRNRKRYVNVQKKIIKLIREGKGNKYKRERGEAIGAKT